MSKLTAAVLFLVSLFIATPVFSASISGVVLDEVTGFPIYGVGVNAASLDSTGSSGGALSGPDGSYTIQGLSPGNYRLWVNVNQTGYAPEFYPGTVESASATVMTLYSDTVLQGVEFTLRKGAVVSGRVLAEGVALAGVRVSAIPDGLGFHGSGTTDATGYYRLTAVAPGNYRVRVEADNQGYGTVYYPSAYRAEDAELLALWDGQTAGVDFDLNRDSDRDGLSDQQEVSLGTDPGVADTDGDGALDGADIHPLTVDANLLWAGVYHENRDATIQDTLSVGILGKQVSLNDLSVSVTGPNGFNYTFTQSDIWPWFDGVFHLAKFFPNLEPGHYLFQVTDATGHTVSRTDLHGGVLDLPSVDPATIQFNRDPAAGSYRVSWAPVPINQPLYYRLRINRQDGTPVHVSSRGMAAYTDVPAGILLDGETYQARVEAWDGEGFDVAFNRSTTGYQSFTPWGADEDTIIRWWRVYNRKESNGISNIAFSVGVKDPSAVTLAEVSGPNGFYYSFDLSSDLDSQFNEYVVNNISPASAGPGRYVFHLVAWGKDYYAYSTLNTPEPIPVPDSALYQAQTLANGNLRLSWADVDYTGALCYRVGIRDNVSGRWFLSSRSYQAYADIDPVFLQGRIGSGPYEWKVEAYDSPEITTARNRVNGPLVPLSVEPYEPDRPEIRWGFVTHRITSAGSAAAWDVSPIHTNDDIEALLVSGPNGFERNLLDVGQYYRFENGLRGFSLVENHPPGKGLYSFAAVGQNGKQAVRYNFQPDPLALSPIDYRAIQVDTDPDGRLRFSWAPIGSEIPLGYRLEIWTATNRNGDGIPERVYVGSYRSQTSEVIHPNSLPAEPLMFRVSAVDGVSPTVYNNRTTSAWIGYEGPGFAYQTLTDGDGDGCLSNADPDDGDSTLTPFSADLLPPEAPVVSGASPTNSRRPTWTWSSAGGEGLGIFRYHEDTDDFTGNYTVTTEVSVTAKSDLQDGAYTLYVQERDAADNWSTSGFFTAVVDTASPAIPVVTAVSPTASVRPTWTWTSGGGGNGTFRYQLNDANLSYGAIETIATSFVPPEDLSPGVHTLYVQERDGAGNWSAAGSFSVEIDPAPVAQHWNSPVFTPYVTDFWGYVTVGGLDAQPGDEVAIYDPDGALCGHYVIDYAGSYGVVAVYGDDPGTPEDEGAAAGDRLTFRIWDSSEGKELRGKAKNISDPGVPVVWAPDSISQVDLEGFQIVSVTLPLQTGWNLISLPLASTWYVGSVPVASTFSGMEPIQVSSIDEIFSSIAGKFSLIRSFDMEGSHTYDPAIPEFFNNLTYVAGGYGYWVKMTEPAELVLEGPPMLPLDGLQLKAGWNLVGYWGNAVKYVGSEPSYAYPNGATYTAVSSISEILSSLGDKLVLVRSFDSQGAHTYDPSLPDFFNNLTYMGPGYSYWIKVSEDVVLHY